MKYSRTYWIGSKVLNLEKEDGDSVVDISMLFHSAGATDKVNLLNSGGIRRLARGALYFAKIKVNTKFIGAHMHGRSTGSAFLDMLHVFFDNTDLMVGYLKPYKFRTQLSNSKPHKSDVNVRSSSAIKHGPSILD